MPKTAEQLQLLKDKRRQKIILCSLKLFCKKGYDKTSIDDVTKAAKCSHGLFYHYFKSKKDIFVELIETNHTENDMAFKSIAESENSQKEKLCLCFKYFFEKIKNDENFAYFYYLKISKFFNDFVIGNKERLPKPNKTTIFDYLYDIISKGRENGEFKSDHSAKEYSILFWNIVDGESIHLILLPTVKRKQITHDYSFFAELFCKNKETL